MRVIIDTNVFIRREKLGKPIQFSAEQNSQGIYISVITVSELLVGVHRANTEQRRQRRAEFVETVISGVGVLELTVPIARLHAEIYSEIARVGKMIGAHDLIIAATARYHDLEIVTDNIDEFSRVSGLRIVPLEP
jgi:predicted nucleic acid-binding protein